MYIVDIGARDGLHPRWERFQSDFKAILFEPEPKAFDRLKATVSDDYIVLNSALSDFSGEIDFYLCKQRAVSSVYKPDLTILSRYYTDIGQFEIVNVIKVAVDTLDNQLKKIGLIDVDFIKVDVQGHELPILRAGINTLENVIGIEAEVEFLPLYKDQPVFATLDSFLRRIDFELFDIKRTFRNRSGVKIYNRRGQLLWGDALYFRVPESILSMPNVTAQKIIDAIRIYLVYGYPDLAEKLLQLANEKALLSENISDEMERLLVDYEIEDINTLPEFRGKRTIHKVFNKLACLFSSSCKTDKQEDRVLGNI